MNDPNHLHNDVGSLPTVHKDTIRILEEESPALLDLYKRVFDSDEEIALFIRRRAQEISPNDLETREEIAILALEVIEIEKRQMLVNGLNKLFSEGKASNEEVSNVKSIVENVAKLPPVD